MKIVRYLLLISLCATMAVAGIEVYSEADINARMMNHDNEVLIINQQTGRGMAWNTISQTWTKVKYFGPLDSSDVIPRGAFMYDTISTIELFGEKRDLFYFDDIDTTFFTTEDTSTWDDPAADTNDGYEFKYQTPEYGDGVNYWEIPRVQITFSGYGPEFQFRIISNEDDTLATSTFTPISSTAKDYTVGFAHHAAKSLSVEFSTDEEGGEINIHEMTIYLRKVGRNRVK